jgi:DNA modification methylase
MVSIKVYNNDVLEILPLLEENSIDAVITDPPYGLSDISQNDTIECIKKWVNNEQYDHNKNGFMNNKWDNFVPGPDIWKEVFRVLKPGAHMLVFSGTRTMDLATLAIRLAGFEIRDNIGYSYDNIAPLLAWVNSQGMPKGLDIDKAIKKTHKENNDWLGWNTGLKPAWEPIILAKKPISEKTIAENVLKYSTGGINIDDSRIKTNNNSTKGRYPSNFIHDGSDLILQQFPNTKSGAMKHEVEGYNSNSVTTFIKGKSGPHNQYGDSGNASRFFYASKANKKDRNNSLHPTVKPQALLKYLIKLITPPNGIILDCFAGSGSLGVAALSENFSSILIEKEFEYFIDINKRLLNL